MLKGCAVSNFGMAMSEDTHPKVFCWPQLIIILVKFPRLADIENSLPGIPCLDAEAGALSRLA